MKPNYTGLDHAKVIAQLIDRELVLQQLKRNLNKAQQHMKLQADKKRQDVQFKVGETVLVKLQPYGKHSVDLRKNNKLAMHYFGLFPIVQRIGAVAYKLHLPDRAKIHLVYHVSQLKAFHGTMYEPYLPLSLTTSELGLVLNPKAVLQTRV